MIQHLVKGGHCIVEGVVRVLAGHEALHGGQDSPPYMRLWLLLGEELMKLLEPAGG